MKIPRACRFEEAVSTDVKCRPAIVEPFLDLRDGVGTMVATDGRILAAVPVEIDPFDTAGHISMEVFKAARKVTSRSEEHLEIPTAPLPRESRIGRTGGCDFPNSWRSTIPQEGAVGVVAVAIDALRLWQLAQAMGTRGVVLHFIPNSTTVLPALVTPTAITGGVMPACAAARGAIMLLGVNAPPQAPVNFFQTQKVNPVGARRLIVT